MMTGEESGGLVLVDTRVTVYYKSQMTHLQNCVMNWSLVMHGENGKNTQGGNSHVNYSASLEG